MVLVVPVAEKKPGICFYSPGLFSPINSHMNERNQATLEMLKANLAELEQAYNLQPNPQLLTNIFQLQVAIQELEASS